MNTANRDVVPSIDGTQPITRDLGCKFPQLGLQSIVRSVETL